MTRTEFIQDLKKHILCDREYLLLSRNINKYDEMNITQEQDGMSKFETTKPMRYKYSCRNCKATFISPFKEPLCKYCGSRDISQHK